MLPPRHILAASVLLALLMLTGCQLFASGQQGAPPPPPEAIRSLPTITPTPLPATSTPEPSLEAGYFPAGAVAPGEIVFVRAGQMWAIGADGGRERQLAALPPGAVLRELTLAPDGRHIAFTVNSHYLCLYNLDEGLITVRDRAETGLIGMPAWLADGSALVYQKVAFDPATSLPVAGEIWQVGVGSADVPYLLLTTDLVAGSELMPGLGLSGGLLLLSEFQPAGDMLSHPVLLMPGGNLSPLTVEGLTAPAVWDVSPDLSKLLVYDQAEGAPEGPATLYTVNFDPLAGLSGPVVVADDEDFAFRMARFAPDSRRIIALRVERAAGPAGAAEVVLFAPAEDGSYGEITLAPDPAYTTLAFSWYGEEGVIAQRYPVAGGDSELWLLPLNGSPGVRLTVGEQPVVALAGQ